ncbi:MAG: NUDIX hydrolase [Planctomycetia bacterium]|nr:NUDIX hydrolase [Planctomycetia bacterium]
MQPDLSAASHPPAAAPTRRGVVIVVREAERFLVIRRSEFVVAPRKHCFPGGHIEAGESEEEAVIREFREELGGHVLPQEPLWKSVSPRGVQLSWWSANLAEASQPLKPDPAEVEAAFWCSPAEMTALPELLDSNRTFLEYVLAGTIRWRASP